MDEPALIRDARSGDLRAFNTLVLAYQSRAFNLAYRIMGEPEGAADATQQAMLSAFRGLRQFRGGSFRAWLMRIVTNACYDELRRHRRRPELSLEGMAEQDDADDGTDRLSIMMGPDDPEALSDRRELARAIQRCLDRLPTEFRIVAVLVDVQGHSYEEAAAIAGAQLGTVKSRLARARARLRDCLREHGELLPSAYRLEDEGIR